MALLFFIRSLWYPRIVPISFRNASVAWIENEAVLWRCDDNGILLSALWRRRNACPVHLQRAHQKRTSRWQFGCCWGLGDCDNALWRSIPRNPHTRRWVTRVLSSSRKHDHGDDLSVLLLLDPLSTRCPSPLPFFTRRSFSARTSVLYTTTSARAWCFTRRFEKWSCWASTPCSRTTP